MALQEEMEAQGNFLFRHRSKLPLIILIAGLLVFSYGEYLETMQSKWKFENLFQFTCLVVCLIGLLVRIYTVGHTPQNTSGRNTSQGQVADKLNTTGIYSLVRHPLYVGNFLMWLGFAMLTENLWFVVAFVFIYWVYYERIMFAEEQFLRRKFGSVYLEWAAKTPAFIPRLSGFRSPSYPFSFRKVLKNEKAGLLNVFLLFFIFQHIEGFIETRSFVPQFDFWAIALLSSILFYTVIKILKKIPELLSEEGR